MPSRPPKPAPAHPSGLLTVLLTAALLLATAHAAGKRVWRPAVVKLSDGTTITGRVHFTQNSLNIFNEKQERRYDVPLTDMQRLDTLIERQYMDEKWIFREDGRDEKVYTGEKYPIRRLSHRATFGGGKTLTGKIHGRAVYVKTEDGAMQRFALKRKLEGEVGDTLDDLVYVKSIVFQDKTTGVLGQIVGTVFLPGNQQLITAVALNRDTDLSLKARTNRAGRFMVNDAMAGTYDFFIVAGTYPNMGGKARPAAEAIYCFLSREREKGAVRLNAEVLKKLEKWKKNVRSVFNIERPVYGAGDPTDIYTLVHMQRTDKLAWSFPEQWKWVEILKRFEVWHMSKRDDDWQIQKRHFLHRELVDNAKDPAEKIVVDPRLGGHVLDAEHPKLKLTFELKATGENPAPPAPQKN
jgi:hypothetical protein